MIGLVLRAVRRRGVGVAFAALAAFAAGWYWARRRSRLAVEHREAVLISRARMRAYLAAKEAGGRTSAELDAIAALRRSTLAAQLDSADALAALAEAEDARQRAVARLGKLAEADLDDLEREAGIR